MRDEHKRKIRILTTGGTIAGRTTEGDASRYVAGAITAAQLVASVPGLDALAAIEVESVMSIDSASSTPAHWLQLLDAVQSALAASVDGVVITHGTDSLEETAFFMQVALADLAPEQHAPVVFVGAMRPADAVSADGPANLLAAVTAAVHPGLNGVSVVMNETIFDPWSLTKSHTHRVDAFAGGARGYVAGGVLALHCTGGAALAGAALAGAARTAGARVDVALAAVRNFAGIPGAHVKAPTKLARVPLAMLHVGFDSCVLYDMALNADGLVVAGFGAGNFCGSIAASLAEIAAEMPVIRASRVPQGAVLAQGGFDDAESSFLTLGDLSALKARALLSWVLATE